MKYFALFFVAAFPAAAQSSIPQVPHKLNVAGITLTIRDEARREIQKDVDALCQSPKHFNIKAERARTYFPIIEKIFAEERVPDDFKYLVLQESALIADAVSVSNAVGFWQFKDFTATEMGLRVDETIDERMNIAAATRGAAKYIKRNNYEFNNWIYALQAYQMGAGGVLRSVRDVESGTRHMTITSETYWYVKKFLAHKIAFSDAVGVAPQQPVQLVETNKSISLDELAASLSVPAEDLLAHNKWIRNGTIPGDRVYYVTVPRATSSGVILASNREPAARVVKTQDKAETSPSQSQATRPVFVTVNGVRALVAKPGETITTLAQHTGVSLPLFMTYNDLQGHEKIQTGVYYYADKKKARAGAAQVVAREGDNLWRISQQHGVSLKKLRKYNRTKSNETTPGQAIWLASRMPKNYNRRSTATQPMGDSYFTWSAPAVATASLTTRVTPTEVVPAEIAVGTAVVEQPTTEAAQEVETTHEVRPTDTLYSIAREHGVTIKDLMDWNNKKNFGVTAGEKLKVLKK